MTQNNKKQPSKLQSDLKQFGFWGFLKRIVKFFLRKIGINYNSYYYMVNHIDTEARRMQFEAAKLPPVKELTYDDFLLGDKTIFTDNKLNMIKQRLQDDGYHAYGIVENGQLIYSCWISLKKLESSNACVEGLLDDNEGLLVDAYCSPAARGRGLHGAMNAYRLWQLSQNGKSQAVGIVLKENKPAYKSQLKVGFEVAFTYYVANVWGKTFTNYPNRKKTYREKCSK